MISLDEAIKHAEEVAEEQDMKAGFETDNQTYTMSEMERKRCRECAEEHRQLAEWLKDYKRLLEQEPCEDAISRQAVIEYIEGSEAELGHSSENELVCQDIKEFPPVTPKPCEEREQGKCPFYAN